jgi:hypothetical protein
MVRIWTLPAFLGLTCAALRWVREAAWDAALGATGDDAARGGADAP